MKLIGFLLLGQAIISAGDVTIKVPSGVAAHLRSLQATVERRKLALEVAEQSFADEKYRIAERYRMEYVHTTSCAVFRQMNATYKKNLASGKLKGPEVMYSDCPVFHYSTDFAEIHGDRQGPPYK